MATVTLPSFRPPATALRGMVFDVQRFCLHDGPGIRTTVFLKGCPLNCFWCHNPEGLTARPQLMFTQALCTLCGECVVACPNSAHRIENGHHYIDRDKCVLCGACVAACPTGALSLSGQQRSVEEVLEIVQADRAYYDASDGGVTLSGGEPLAQVDYARELLQRCRSAGIHTALDTSLHADWSEIESVLDVVDLWLVDVKHADSARHREGTGVDNGLIIENLRRLASRDARIIIRVPLVPGYNASAENATAIADLVASLGAVEMVELLPYHSLGEGKRQGLGLPTASAVAPLSVDQLKELVGVFAERDLKVRCTGVPPEAPPSTDPYARRLAALHATKLRHTTLKRQEGPRDVDDWGQIPLEGRPVPYTPQTNHPKGRILGPRDCGVNFRRFLNACPTYVDPNSSLLGGYYATFAPTGWDPDCRWDHLVPDQQRYGIIHGIASTQHFLSDVSIGLELGWGGVLAKIDRYRAINTSDEQQAFYDGLTEFVRGVQDWIARHAAAARETAKTEPDAELRANLIEMAQINERLVSAPPATFREVCQWLGWYQMAKRVYIGGGPIGRIDRLLWPYYQRERDAGTLSADEAIFHLACFLLKDSSYVQIGGVDEQGRDVTNPVSLLVLEAAHRMRIPANIAVMVYDGMDPVLMRRAVELLLADKMGIPRFGGVTATVDGFVRRGFPIAAARNRVQAGCHWYCVPGREYSFCDVIKVNTAKVLLAALDEMMGDGGSPGVARLWGLFEKHMRRAVEVVAQGIDFHMEHQHKFHPELALSVLCHGPIEKGVDASHGSLEFTNIGVDASAIATTADSFAAIEQRIERERAATWEQLHRGLRDNWAGAGRLRSLMRSAGGFGRDERADQWAQRVSQSFAKIVIEKPTPAGHLMSPGLFSWASTIPMGRETPATPDGRLAGESISFGANPNSGRLHGGAVAPTTASTAIASVQCGYGNPAPFQFDVDPVGPVDEDAIAKFEALLRTHFRLGGTLVNANVLDREMVLDACRNPGKYPDLIVRVTGFSAYFASLSDDFRELVRQRIIHGG